MRRESVRNPETAGAGNEATIGWAGVRLTVPARWEVAWVGRDHLLLGEDGQPRLEFKSAKVPGSFHLERHLRALGRQRRREAIEYRTTPVPLNWRPMTEPYRAGAFTWRSARYTGRGILLFCPCCQRATLLQFFHHRNPDEGLVERVLSSFAAHPAGGWNLVALYDIRCEIPDRFDLRNYRFEPGYFRLAFDFRATRFTVHRWGPADALLRQMDLPHLAVSAGLLSPGAPAPCRPSPEVVQWSWQEQTRGLLRAFWRRPLATTHCLKVWRTAAANRIQALRFQCRAPEPEPLFEELCQRYAVVSQTIGAPRPDA
jgi:hypothetical protein